jgi:RTX calcium-binding nonapeptide repeat (4 copies)
MPDAARPKLIAFVSDVSARTQFILANEAHIDSLPFDGIVVNIPASWSQMSPGAVVLEADVRAWLAPLTAFNVGRENYLAMEIDRPGDLFDDAAWAQVVANWKAIGKVAAETGFTGIFFDNEEYAGHWQNFPEDFTPAEAARGLAAYQAKASQRGAELMQALADVMPNAKLALAHGPYLSVPAGPGAPPAITLQAGGPDGQELRGPFFTGFLKGMGPGQHLIDAGELYALRSAADFQQSFDYRNSALPGLIPWAVDADALAHWAERVDQGHIVYSNEFPQGFTHSPKTIVNTLLNAFDHSEGAVFLYSESAQCGWLAPGTISAEWVAAVRMAVELADHTTRGGAGAEVLVGSAFMDRLHGGAAADMINGGDGDDRICGQSGADTLMGANGNDTIHGGMAADTITGNAGADILSGEAGNDTFRYLLPGDSTVAAAGRDTIIGFDMAGNDLIDLRPLDAIAATAGDDAFTFIGAAAFTAAGQIRVAASGGDTLVEINTGGTLAPDMALLLQGTAPALVAADDFVL